MNDPSVVSLTPPQLPFGFARRHGVVMTGRAAPWEAVCRAPPLPPVLAEVRRFAAASVRFAVVDEDRFNQIMEITYQQSSDDAMAMVADIGEGLDLARLAAQVPETEDLLEQAEDAPVVRLINAVLAEAISQQASDIHIETFETRLAIRFRIDGVLRDVVQPRRALASLLVSRIKVMAKLDIAEKRLPQDGRISLRLGGRDVDVRVSTMPASHGERVVLRLLDKQAGRIDLSGLGMRAQDLSLFEELLRLPHGILLVTGPTGSGKTTTLYAGLKSINDRKKNILTVEDPVEYNLEGVGQTQVNIKAGMTFARGLRAILRQDPDVVMVGEIRDIETVQIAVQASLTGHLVLSTLHTNTAVGAVTRLIDMGVEPFLLSSSLVGVLAQRLVRVLCRQCRQPWTPEAQEREFLGLPADTAVTIFRPAAGGCADCHHQGYRGRCGIYELLVVDETLRQLIHDRASEAIMTAQARVHGLSIRADGCRNVLSGVTALEEVLRVTQEQ
ncbi:MAG: type II secretion system ATPase GspE [Porticoccaceae bacterium]